MDFGIYFRRGRERSGLTEAEMVERLRAAGCVITLKRYLRIEAGLSDPFLHDAMTMSRIMGIDIDAFFDDALPDW